jgi:hypothetical protein
MIVAKMEKMGGIDVKKCEIFTNMNTKLLD